MTLVVGLPRDERATAAMHMGVMLARSLGQDLAICTVVPAPWPAGMGKIDAEFQSYLDGAAHEALERARDLLPADIAGEFLVKHARSTPSGLLELAAERDAAMVVLGSSTAGVLGRVAFGSVAERLLHTSPVPVGLGPRGYRCATGARVARVTTAYGASERDDELVVAVSGVAARAGAALRVASFGVRPRTPLTAGIGSRAEDAVLDSWSADVDTAQQAAIAHLPHAPAEVTTVIGRGTDWAGALEDIGWADGDVLVVGSSSEGPLERVFLGSRSSRIVRHSPVPVIVVPRGAAHALAERAEQP
ncbi:universal stress protein [Pseudonocardia sp. GCM10023141]|uniref:universal stress protein n=1 Tax=Pseudonocardia sp. GCM10023141 TaxID=3252653 RepID=UPI003619B9F3